MFAKHEIKYVLAQFVDIHGAAKAKAVPVEHLRHGADRRRRFRRLRAVGLRHGSARAGLHGRRRPSTLTPIPWMPGFARMVCDGT